MTPHDSTPSLKAAVLTPGLATAIATIAILLTACSDGPDTQASAGNDPATSTPTQSSPTQPPPAPDGWTPIPENTDGFLPAGRLGMTANGRPDTPWAVLQVPEHFTTIGGWVIFDERHGGGVSYWTVSEVVRDPCSEPHPMDAGNTVDELVATLQRQRLTRTTTPQPVTVDGYQGLSLELHPPKNTDFDRCTAYNVWESDPAGARHMEAPGEFDRLWILDVKGNVVVLTVTADPNVSQSSLNRLAHMVKSVEFIPR